MGNSKVPRGAHLSNGMSLLDNIEHFKINLIKLMGNSKVEEEEGLMAMSLKEEGDKTRLYLIYRNEEAVNERI